MSIVKVYRFEDPTGHGPYTSDIFQYRTQWQSTAHLATTGRPGPNCDDPIKRWVETQPGYAGDYNDVIHEYSFGFISMDQLNMWFDEHERMKLTKHGFKIVVYHIDIAHIIEGDTQVMFLKWRAYSHSSIEDYKEFEQNKAA